MEIEERPSDDRLASEGQMGDQAEGQAEYATASEFLVSFSESSMAIAREIATVLQETDPVPLEQLARTIEVMGEAFAREVLAETLKVEEAGGMLTNSGNRRRTAGGVYFYLIKGRLTPEERGKIFPHLAPRHKPGMTWEEREEVVRDLVHSGVDEAKLNTAILQLIGYVTEWRQVKETVILKMVYGHRSDFPLPRAVPSPAEGAPTSFIVYIGPRHWEKMSRVIQDGRDPLVVEGVPFLDRQTNTLAVMAIFVSSKDMLKNERRQLIGENFSAASQPLPTRQEQKRQAEARKAAGGKPTPAEVDNGKIPVVKPKRTDRPSAKPETPSVPSFTPAAPAPSAPPALAFTPPPGVPAHVAAKLQQLHQAAHTLRERIAAMEAKKQPGSAMTRKLLENTEKQIDTLTKQYS